MDGTTARETGMGNAVVGAYLTRIGLPLDAVVYITKAAPEDMTWLTPADGKKVGIEFAVLEDNEPKQAQVPMPPTTPTPTQPQRARPQPTVPQWQETATIRYKLAGGKVIELSKLSYGCGSGGSRAVVGGKVVKVDFAKDGIWITGFVLEKKDGERTFINVDLRENLDKRDMVDRGYVKLGLQTLLRQGRNIHGEVELCGVAGRMMDLDSVW
jgi:hypothetical protein